MTQKVLSVNSDGDYPEVTVFNASADVDHDQTTNFVTDEHVAHSSISVVAGGDDGVAVSNNDLSADIDIAVDIAGTTDIADDIVDDDEFFIYDTSNTALRRTDASRLKTYIASSGVAYTATSVSKGDLVYISANNTVAAHDTLANAEYVVGAALTGGSGTITVAANDTVVTGVLTGLSPAAGDRVFWTGTGGLSLSRHTTSGEQSWQAGVAKNADDMHVEVRYITTNA